MNDTNQAEHENDGVRVTRRLALHGGAALPALWMLSRLSESGANAYDVEALLQRWTERTAALVEEDDPDEEAHLLRLCADLSRVDPATFPPRKTVSFEKDGKQSGPILAAMPFLVLQFDLEPGAVIEAHNHVGWGFVSMGVRGEALVRHFEVAEDAPEPGVDLETTFLAREVASTVLLPGRTSSLTRSRANIHWFRAGEDGATFFDFGVNLADPGDGPTRFSAMEVADEPADAERRLYESRWLGNIYK